MSLEKWKEICQEFYFENNSRAAEIMALFDTWRQEMESQEEDQCVIKIPEENNETWVHLMNELFLKEENTMKRKERLYEMENVKNQVRKAFHHQRMKEQQIQFSKLLESYPNVSYYQFQASASSLASSSQEKEHMVLLPRSSESHLCTIQQQNYRIKELKQFLRFYQHSLGSQPFVHGLKHLFQSQLSQIEVIGWELDDSLFYESQGEVFMKDALHLLMTVFQFGNYPTSPDVHIWQMDPYLSNAFLHKLIKCFPSNSIFHTKPSGQHVSTFVQRLNPHGLMDEQLSFFQKCCWIL